MTLVLDLYRENSLELTELSSVRLGLLLYSNTGSIRDDPDI